jgi:hypothetical protein
MIYFSEKYDRDSIAKVYWPKAIKHADSVSAVGVFYKTCQSLLTSIFRAKNADKQCDETYFNLIVQADAAGLLMEPGMHIFPFSIFRLTVRAAKEKGQKNKKDQSSPQPIHQAHL